MKVGILGGGQLGWMLAESLQHLGADVAVLEPESDAPCAKRLARVTSAAFDDAAAVGMLFAGVSVATYDSENVPAGPLRAVASQLRPSLSVLETSQHRAVEKAFLASHGFGPVAFSVVAQGDDVAAKVRAFGLPCIAKSALGGYDGKGQHRLTTDGDVAKLPPTPSGGWVLEEVLQLRAEVSCIVARDGRGGEFTFPTFENLHAHHVLDVTVLPARIEPSLQAEAQERAVAIARALEVEGLLTVEFFIGTGRDGVERLYVNELAPRVHNSGHVTRQACTVSQFDALARILVRAPLTPPVLHPGAWCMGNLLGDVWLAQGRTGGSLGLSAWADFPDVVDVTVYGKREARPQRKMGHFVVRAETADTAVARARAFRDALRRSQ